ncbi:hypothetical protein [Microbacterium thalli]|uniref:Signal transduction histidine kinase n=1 Tax=Microbacterium thalli TaxID=3027921 RepID=A0ABT5SKU5_9MICO|nr:hypothetical protein [Microbacterium thalli]MDD7963449.1 hypothetical protein [Microbacterium thalli]MDN8548977.1 hypothetical protein [Microbacterium thalli]
MSRGDVAHAIARLRRGAAIWWAAVSSGRFFTAWSIVVAVPLAVIVLAPYQSADTVFEVIAAEASAAVAVAVLMVVLLPVALLERRLRTPVTRAALVLGAVLAVSVARPFLNDALAVGAFGLEPDTMWATRIVTNIVAWTALLSLVAITEQLYASSREARERLAGALRTVTDEQRRAYRYDRDSRDLLDAEVAALRAALARLRLSPVDFDAVREFADEVRSASHRLQLQAAVDLAVASAADPTAGLTAVPHRRFVERLRPPPLFLVGVIFAAGSMPFAYNAGGWGLLFIVVAGVVGVGLGTDLLTRRLSRRLDPRSRGAVVLGVWTLAGLIVSGIGAVLVPGSLVPAIPALAVPGLAVLAALCADAVHRGRIEARRLGRALRDVARATAVRAAGARQALMHAADTLHGRVQGTCVIFAAQVDDEPATPDALARFERSVDAALVAVLDPTDAAETNVGLAETVAVWQPVIAVSTAVDAPSERALEDPSVSLRVVSVVAEGLVNAVKHAASPHAAVAVVALPEDSTLHVTVSSPGQLRADAQLAGGLGVSLLGPSARVFQRDGEVVLEAVIPVVQRLADTPHAVGALQDSDSM